MPPNATITPDHVLSALGKVRSGRLFDLGVTIAPETARLPGQQPYSISMAVTPDSMREMMKGAGIETDVGFAIDKVEMDLHTGTHVDALGHVARGDAMHGGARVGEIVHDSGLAALASQDIPPIISRGVLLDVAKVAGRKSLPLGHVVTADDLQKALRDAGVTLQAGDVALVHTGWLGEHFADPPAYVEPGYPGIDLDAANLLIEQGAFAIAVDNISIEPMLSQQADDLARVHVRCLLDAGVYLIENVQTQELADAGVTEFAFVCASVKFEGGTGGPVRPLALI